MPSIHGRRVVLDSVAGPNQLEVTFSVAHYLVSKHNTKENRECPPYRFHMLTA
jgi:hypothetical protein